MNYANIEEQAARSGYRDAGEYVRAIIEAEQHRTFQDRFEQSLVDAMNDPSTPLTSADFDEIRRRGRERIEKGSAR